MKLFGGLDTVALKQHFGKKIMELEDEKRTVQVEYSLFSFYTLLIVEELSLMYVYFHVCRVQQERDRLLAEVENLAANSDGHTQKMQDIHAQKLKTLEAQVMM